MQVKESPPATLVAQIDRGPDFVRPDESVPKQFTTYRSPHTSLVHEGG